jgi:4'-phosphopantetheinyl transferase
MLKIYHADSAIFKERYDLEKLLSFLPLSLHVIALRYRMPQDAFNFVLGKLMLKKGLEELGVDNDLEKIQFNKNQKPFLADVFFNISHSGNYVVCAVTQNGEVGIDLEKPRDISLEDFEMNFTKKEWTNIITHSFSLKKFYWYWVRKESIIKALGVNLSYLNQIELEAGKDFFIENGRRWFLKDLSFRNDCFFAICSAVEFEKVEMIEYRV